MLIVQNVEFPLPIVMFWQFLIFLLQISGASPVCGSGANFFFSDLESCMSRSDMLRRAKPCALLGGSGACSPKKIILKRCNGVRFRVYFDQILFLFFFKIYYFLYKKINILDTLLLSCYGVFLMKFFLKTSYD